MAKQLNIDLNFTANTTQAKQQLQQLQQQLSNLTAGVNLGGGTSKLTQEIQQSINAAAQLQYSLQQATNVNTGKLDLGKFNQQLKQSGMSIQQYAAQLKALGPQGTEAFMSLSRSIANAELPLIRVSSKLRELGTVIKNTAKWQISSGMLHGFMSAISGAYQYAQDLNKSLNNIRIVTGLSIDEMDKFADKANKAAKALSTTTTAYTDAALIYYQQGLEGKAVEERAETTIKLANVVDESAETVSEWMTAVWNNFDDGSKKLEYYADVMAALGAATASSADEIAGGLEKFAAVAETVGLSYEYATSALATITATTRQSEDVVGTALKTLFARIQDLDLGKTLDDGTTLGSYSEALAKVGINIKTSAGDLRDMNSILKDMGAVWKTIDKDQQVALAKSVAGIRQYTQLIALMDNFDYFEQNVAIAEASSGALQEQADIYEESWEAASKRVRASLENIYSNLISDDFFIDILNGLEDIIGFVDNLIKSLGGMPGLLSVISTLMLNTFGGTVAKGLQNIALSFQSLTKNGREKQVQTKQEAFKSATDIANQTMSGEEGTVQMASYRREAEVQQNLYNNSQNISEEQNEIYKIRLQGLKVLEEENIQLAKQIDLLNQTSTETIEKMGMTNMIDPNLIKVKDSNNKTQYKNSGLAKASEDLGRAEADLADKSKTWTKEEAEKRFGDHVDKRNFDSNNNLTDKGREQIIKSYSKDLGELQDEIATVNGYTKEQKQLMIENSQNMTTTARKTQLLEQANKNAEKGYESLNQDIINSKNNTVNWSQGIVAAAQGISTLSMGINMVVGAVNQISTMFKEGEFSISSFLSVLTSLGMAIPMVLTSFNQMHQVINKDSIITLANTIVKGANAKATDKQGKESVETAAQRELEAKAVKDLNEEELKNLGIKKLNNGRYQGNNGKVISGNANVGDSAKNGKINQVAGEGAVGGSTSDTGGITSLGSALGTIGATAAIAAVAIAAIVAGIKLADNAMNKHKKELEKAKKETQLFKEEYEKTAEISQTFKSSMDAWTDSADKLDKLTKGTLEYRQALLASNEEALKLIESSDRLKEAGAYKLVNGKIEFDETALEEAYEEKLDSQSRALNSQLYAQINQNEAQMNYNQTETLKDIDAGDTVDFDEGAGWAVGGGLGAVIAGAVALGISNVWNPVGWAALIAGGLTAAGGAIAGFAEGDDEAAEVEAIDNLTQAYRNGEADALTDENIKQAFIDAGYSTESVEKNLEKSASATRDLIISNEQLRAQNEALTQQIADAIVEDLFGDDTSKSAGFKGAISEYQQDLITSEKMEKTTDDFENMISNEDHFLVDAYNKMYKDQGRTLESMYGTHGTVTTINADGSSSEEEVHQDTIAKQITNGIKEAAMRNDTEFLSSYKTMINKSEYISDEEKEKLIAAIENTFNTYTKLMEQSSNISTTESQITSMEKFSGSENQIARDNLLTNLYGKEEDIDFSFLTREQLAELEANKDSFDNELQSKISKGVREYEDKLKKANEKASKDYNHANTKAQKRQDTLTALELTEKDAQTYTSSLEKAYNISEEYAETIANNNLKAMKTTKEFYNAFDKYGDYLDPAYEGTIEFSQGIAQLQKAYSSWTGSEISYDTAIANLNDLKLAAQGNIEAINRLREAAFNEILVKIDLDPTNKTELDMALKELDNVEIGIGTTLDNSAVSAVVSKINEMIKEGIIKSEDAIKILEAKGYVFEDTGTNKDGTIATEKGTYYGNQVTESMSQETAKKEKDRAKTARKKAKEIKENRDSLFEEKEAADKLTKSYDRISKAKKRAYGADKIALGKQERVNIQEQIEANNTLIDGYKKLAKEKRNALISQFGAQFDTDGNMTNYEEVFKILGDRVIAATEADDEDAIEAAEENFETFKNMYGEYNEYREEQQSKELENIDKQAEIIQSRLDDIDYIIELQVQVNDSELEDLERRIELLDRGKNWDIAKTMSLTGEQAQIYTNKSSDYLDAARSVLKEKGLSNKQINKIMSGDAEALKKAELSPEELEAFQGYIQNAKKESRSGLDTVYNGLDKVAEYREGLIEDIDKLASKVGDFKSQIDALSTIADLTGKNTGKIAENLRKASAEAAKANTAIAKTKYETLVSQAADLESEINKTTDETAKAILQQQLDNINSQIPGVLGEFYSAVADEMQVQIDNYNAELKETLDEMSRDMWNGMTSDELQTAYDRQKELKELYLTEYEKTYELNKLTRKLQSEIDKTDNIQSQKQLNRLLEKANLLYGDDIKLSKNQLTLLEKEIEAEKALIALEEGRNAKSQVQLQRNALGGFSYVYTANQENIADLQQAYEDSMYAYNEALTSMVEGSESAIIEIYGQWEEALLNLDVTAEDYYTKMEEVNAHYTALIEYHTGQIDWGLGQSNQFLQQHAENYSGNLNEMLGSTDDWLTSFDQLFISGGYNGKDSAQQIVDNWKNHMGNPNNPDTTLGKIKTNFDNLQSELNIILNTNLKSNLDTFGETIDKLVNGGDGEDGIVDQLGDAEQGAVDLAEELSTLGDIDLSSWANTLIGDENSGLKGIENAALAAQQAIQTLNEMEIKEAEKQLKANYTYDKSKYSDYANKTVNVKSGKTANLNIITGGNASAGTGTAERSGDTLTSSNDDGWVYTGNSITKDYGDSTREFLEIKNKKTGETQYIARGNVDLPSTQQKTVVPSTAGEGDGNVPAGNDDKQETEDVGLKPKKEEEDDDRYQDPGDPVKTLSGTYSKWYLGNISADGTVWKAKQKNKKVDFKNKGTKLGGSDGLVELFGGMLSGAKIYNTGNDSAILIKFSNASLSSNDYIKKHQDEYYWISKGALHYFMTGSSRHDQEVKGTKLDNLDVDGKSFTNYERSYMQMLLAAGASTYDTGGYTGQWGPEGKLAMLHQKEIVLNAHDTENFLNAIEIVRQLAAQIDLQAASMASGAWLNTLQTLNISGSHDTLDQNVTIHAEFPNVTQHSEIEEALTNLVNKASQFANRKGV